MSTCSARIKRGRVDQGGCATLPAEAGSPSRRRRSFLEIGPVSLLNETLRAWAMHREFRAVLAELQHYSDRELTELGIGRGDIARVAYEEAERRIVTPAAAAGSEPPVVDWPASAAVAGR